MNDAPIYLDYAATTPLDPRVLTAMQPYFIDDFYNPSATYTAARKIHVALDDARARAAYWLGARGNEIIFTAGATEANNLAIHGIMRRFPEANIVVSAIEHESVLQPAHHYNARGNRGTKRRHILQIIEFFDAPYKAGCRRKRCR